MEHVMTLRSSQQYKLEFCSGIPDILSTVELSKY